MSRITFLWVAFVSCASLAAAVPFENDSVVGHVPDRVMITLQPGIKLNIDKNLGVPLTGLPGFDNLAVKHGVTEIEPLYGRMIDSFKDPATRELLESVYTVDFSAKAGLKSVLEEYAKIDVVAEVHPVAITRLYSGAFYPNDLSSLQWYLRNATLGGADIRVLGGWAETLGDSNVIVAIPDSGIDWHHPDLGGPHLDKVNGALWTNWAEYYGTPGQDSDGNGYVDDVRGWDFVANVTHPTYDCHVNEDCFGADNDPMDFGGHGTQCAGVVAPLTDNSIGIAGTAPGVKIMALRVGWLQNSGQGVVRMDYCAQAMVYAAGNGARIINCSWGNTNAISSAVTTCLNAGMLIFESAGNSNNQIPSFLGNYNDPQRRVLSVAATTQNDTKASFSSYGTWVDLSAPGVQMYTTHFNHNTGQSTYTSVQGTSFSSPLAAAAAALIWSSDLTMTATQVSQILRDSCDNIDHANPGLVGMLGAGRVNLTRALGDNVQEVPGEYLFLRDAVHCASVGDTIKVLASYQASTVQLLGKSLQILGGYDPGYQTRDPLGNPTVITGTSATSAMRYLGAVDQTSVLDGFHLTSGGGTNYSLPLPGRYGGGIFLQQVSPTLRNLRVSGNSVGSSTARGMGGGIALVNSQAVLEDIVVENNSGIHGAGIFIYGGSPTLTGVTIAGNASITNNSANPPLGGGLHILDAEVILDDVSISGNLDATMGGGLYAGIFNTQSSVTLLGGSIDDNTAVSHGGGLYIDGGSLHVTDTVFSGNAPTATSTSLAGGALYAQAAEVTMTGVVSDQNEAFTGAGAEFFECSDLQLSEMLVTRNLCHMLAAGIYLNACTNAGLNNLTLADNNSNAGQAGLVAMNTTLTVSNTISAFNTGMPSIANGMHFSNSSATLTCNNVFGNDGLNYGGVADPTGTGGNISLDPMFCDRDEGDYQLEEGSPCSPDQSGGCGLIGALGVGCGDLSSVEDPATPLVFRVEANFPNPFNPATTIRFSTPGAARTTVLIFDLKGRLIKELLDAELPASTHSVQWLGDDDRGRAVPAGIYFYRVASGANTAVGRMALVK